MSYHSQISRSGRGLALYFATVLLTTFGGAKAATLIYQETFARPAGAANVGTNNFDWARFNAAGTVGGTTSGVNGGGTSGTQFGKPIDAVNTESAGPGLDNTFAAYATGWAFQDGTIRLAMTPEFVINPDEYEAGSIVFSWYQGNAALGQGFQLAVQVGGLWFVSSTTFDNASISTADTFQTNAELFSLTYNPIAANWLSLTFDGSYDTVSNNATASLVALSSGSAPATDLMGSITAFGLYRNVTGSNGRFDTFAVNATPIPEPASATCLAAALGCALLRRRRR